MIITDKDDPWNYVFECYRFPETSESKKLIPCVKETRFDYDFDFGRDYFFQSDCVIDYENEEISIQTRPYMGDYVTRYFEITDEKPRFNKIVRANL